MTPKPEDKDGYITPTAKTITINADGTATVTYKYERVSYKVQYIDVVKGTKTQLGKKEIGRKWGTTVYGSDIGSSTTVGAYYADYAYDSCTSATVSKSVTTTVYRYFVKKEVVQVNNNVSNNDKPSTQAMTTIQNTTSTNKVQNNQTTTKPNNNANIVKTGETSYAWLFVIAGIAGMIGVLVLIYKRKKK